SLHRLDPIVFAPWSVGSRTRISRAAWMYPYQEHRLPSLLPILPCTLSVVALLHSSSCSSVPDSFCFGNCPYDRVFLSQSASPWLFHTVESSLPRLFSWRRYGVLAVLGSSSFLLTWSRLLFLFARRFA